MLSREECAELHKKNEGQGHGRVWLEPLAANDHRLLLKNSHGVLHAFMGADRDSEEQAQAARMCAALNETVSMRELQEAENL